MKISAHLMGLKDGLFQLQRRKEYWNILGVCCDRRLEMNSLCLGLAFLQLKDHTVVILPEHLVTEVEDLVWGCLRAVSYPRPGERRESWDDPTWMPTCLFKMWKCRRLSQNYCINLRLKITYLAYHVPELTTPEVITLDPLHYQRSLPNTREDSQLPDQLLPVEIAVSRGSQTNVRCPKSPSKARTTFHVPPLLEPI